MTRLKSIGAAVMGPTARPGVDPRGWDTLAVFSIALAHCLALQVMKDAQSLPRLAWATAWRWAPTCLLALSIARCHAAPRSTDALVALAMNGVITLVCNGSQSNHVLLELAICAAVLLCAPSVTGSVRDSGSQRGTMNDDDDDGDASARRAFSRRLTMSMRAALCVLYATTGFAKLNHDWHDPATSCCVQMLVGALSGMGIDADAIEVLAPPTLRRLMPLGATVFELGFPIALLSCTLSPGSRSRGRLGFGWDGKASSTARTLTALGASFHALIALPPPPMSVYPFSMIMAPMYVAALVPYECEVLATRIAGRFRASGSVRLGIGASATAMVAVAMKLNKRHGYFEYPAYFAWELGALWVICAFGALTYAAVAVMGGDSGGSPMRGDEASLRGLRRGVAGIRVLAPAVFIFAVSASTYIGVRTYPSFAMFSNLRVEGGASNHWVFTSSAPSSSFDVIAAGMDKTYRYGVLVTDTDLPSLTSAQVNLAPLLPHRTVDALVRLGINPEFHITPPAWGYPPTTPSFVPYTVPPIEVRRRVSAAARDGSDFFVKYRWVRGGSVDPALHTLVVKGGGVVKGAGSGLDVGVSAFDAWLRRFRTFDVGSSPCRH